MPAKRFNEADIDFNAIDGELAKLVPPKLSLTDVLDRLRKRLIEQQAKGVTVAQMHVVWKSGGIDITERSLRTFLDKGVLPGRKVAEAARAIVLEEGAYGSAKRRYGVRRTAYRQRAQAHIVGGGAKRPAMDFVFSKPAQKGGRPPPCDGGGRP